MRDGAASELIGTILILGLTVTVVAVVGADYLQPRTVDLEPNLDVALRLQPGDSILYILHAGGEPVDRGATFARVRVAGVLAAETPLGAAGTLWRPGQDVPVGLPSPPPPGALVEISVSMPSRGVTLAGSELRVPSSLVAPPAVFTVNVQVVSAFNPVRVPGAVVVVADVAHSGGRGAVRAVVVDLTALNGTASHLLRDDGVGGDAVPGDGIWSSAVDLRPTAPYGTGTLVVTASDASGAKASAGVPVSYTPGPQQYYKSTSFSRVAHKITKIGPPGSGGEENQGDKVRVDVKMQLAAEPLVINGTSYSLKRVEFRYDPFLPADEWDDDDGLNSSPVPLTRVCTGSDPRIQAWSVASAKLPWYTHNRDLLRYYLSYEWESSTGKKVRDLVEGSEIASYFLLREHESNKLVLDNGWTPNLTDCSP